jgi:hypothetical protein
MKSPMSPRPVRFGMQSRKSSNVGQSLDGWPKIYYLEFLRATQGTLSRWSRLNLQSLALTNPHWACVVGYGPFSSCVIHKEGLCPSSGDINRLMMNPSNEWSTLLSFRDRAPKRTNRGTIELLNQFIRFMFITDESVISLCCEKYFTWLQRYNCYYTARITFYYHQQLILCLSLQPFPHETPSSSH